MKRYSIYQSKVAISALDTAIHMLMKDIADGGCVPASEETLAQLKTLRKMRKAFKKKKEFIII